MLTFALLGLMLLAMIIPIAIISALGLAFKGVNSIDLSVLDFYFVIATIHVLVVLSIIEVAVVLAAGYLLGQTQIGRVAAEWLL